VEPDVDDRRLFVTSERPLPDVSATDEEVIIKINAGGRTMGYLYWD
jgi:hypothetical protein